MSDAETMSEPLSTQLEPNAPASPSGGGAPKLEAPEEPAKPASLRDVIAEESKKSEKPADDAKPAEKPEESDESKAKAEKAESADADKPKAKAKDEPDGDDTDAEAVKEAKPDKGADKSQRIDPPSRFLPDAKETWRNTPRAVQRDVADLVKRHEAELTEARAGGERYQALRQFDELARSNGRDLSESLTKLNEIENLMQTNPYAGLNAILREIGPKRADGSAPSLYEVAQFVVKQGPDGWQKMVSARPANDQAQRQPDPEVVALKTQIADMQRQQLTSSVIEPFKADHPRYDELKGDIALFLKSGRIPDSLSMPERLAAAYDMAERINPPSHVDAPLSANPDPDRRVASDSSGSKSIKSAPGSVSIDHAPQRGGSIRDVLESETKRQRRA